MIGRPIGNTQIYLLDAQGNPVPVGSEGEIFIGGAGVTLGYLNKPEHTAERFVDHRWFNPFSNYVSDKIYKTGDIGRYQADGNIEFLRRNDKQVKVRGFRIELGEIEAVLKSHTSVDEGVVIVREDSVGDARLVAYWVGQADAASVREHLRSSLPYYMIPQHMMPLDSMPQTNNGKIDYKALPAPQQNTAEAANVAVATTGGEKLLVEVWQNVLDSDDISIHDNFFDLGGHSLLVMQVITEVESRTGVKLSPRDFLIGTVQQMAEQLEGVCPAVEGSDSSPADVAVASASTAADSVNEKTAVVQSDEKAAAPEETNSTSKVKRLLKFWD